MNIKTIGHILLGISAGTITLKAVVSIYQGLVNNIPLTLDAADAIGSVGIMIVFCFALYFVVRQK